MNFFKAFSEAALSGLNFWFQWFAILGTAIGLVSAIGLFFVRSESSSRQRKILSEAHSKIDLLQTATTIAAERASEMQKRISEKDGQISKLEIEVDKSRQGQTTFFDFNGVKRSTKGPGDINVEFESEETKAFEEIKRLQNAQDWIALRSECEQRIAKSPGWMTPFMFRGLANANLGNLDSAVSDLEYVVERVGDSPGFDQAVGLLEKLQKRKLAGLPSSKPVVPGSQIRGGADTRQ